MLFYFSPFYQRSQQITTKLLALKNSHKLALYQQSKCCFVTSVRALNKNDESKTGLSKEKSSRTQDDSTGDQSRSKPSASAGLSRSEKLKRLKESGFVKLTGPSESSKLKKSTLTIDTSLKRPPVNTEALKAKADKPASAEVSKPKEDRGALVLDSAVLRLAKLIDNLKPSDVSERLLKPLAETMRKQYLNSQPKPKIVSKASETVKEKILKQTKLAPQPQIETKMANAQARGDKVIEKKPQEPAKMATQRDLWAGKNVKSPQTKTEKAK